MRECGGQEGEWLMLSIDDRWINMRWGHTTLRMWVPLLRRVYSFGSNMAMSPNAMGRRFPKRRGQHCACCLAHQTYQLSSARRFLSNKYSEIGLAKSEMGQMTELRPDMMYRRVYPEYGSCPKARDAKKIRQTNETRYT